LRVAGFELVDAIFFKFFFLGEGLDGLAASGLLD
jgi:hypothetical protein